MSCLHRILSMGVRLKSRGGVGIRGMGLRAIYVRRSTSCRGARRRRGRRRRRRRRKKKKKRGRKMGYYFATYMGSTIITTRTVAYVHPLSPPSLPPSTLPPRLVPPYLGQSSPSLPHVINLGKAVHAIVSLFSLLLLLLLLLLQGQQGALGLGRVESSLAEARENGADA